MHIHCDFWRVFQVLGPGWFLQVLVPPSVAEDALPGILGRRHGRHGSKCLRILCMQAYVSLNNTEGSIDRNHFKQRISLSCRKKKAFYWVFSRFHSVNFWVIVSLMQGPELLQDNIWIPQGSIIQLFYHRPPKTDSTPLFCWK